jgi:hypothetical protein
MTEQNPHDGHDADDTQRIPDDTSGGSTHRYDPPAGPTPDRHDGSSSTSPGTPWSPYVSPSEPEDTRVGGFGFVERPGQEAHASTRRSRPGGAVVAALLVAALIVGALGGLAGAVGFSLVDDGSEGDSSSAGSPSAGSSGSPISNSKDVAPAADSVEAVA